MQETYQRLKGVSFSDCLEELGQGQQTRFASPPCDSHRSMAQPPPSTHLLPSLCDPLHLMNKEILPKTAKMPKMGLFRMHGPFHRLVIAFPTGRNVPEGGKRAGLADFIHTGCPLSAADSRRRWQSR
jgi:hypothetical protein